MLLRTTTSPTAPAAPAVVPEAHEAVRELAYRVSDGIHVFLLWYPGDDRVSVRVDDHKTGERFERPVPRAEALFAFHHPFGYAA